MLSLQRQVTSNTVLTVSYVGNQGHHVLAVVSANPGNPALCLSLAGCGPFGEDSTYTTNSVQTVYGTRTGQNTGARISPSSENYGENTADSTIANSNYNALETTLRYQHNGSPFLLSYAYAKSIDQGSNLGEQLDPNDRAIRVPSQHGTRSTASKPAIRGRYHSRRSCTRATVSPRAGAFPAPLDSPPDSR